MKAQWAEWMAKFDALQQRERVMVTLGAVALVWAAFDSLALTPLQNKQKLYRTEIATRQNEVAQFQQQMQQMIQAAKIDPDAGNKQRLAQLNTQLSEKDAALQAMGQQLIAPDRMPRMLESVLQKDKQVKLVSLTTMPVSGLLDTVPMPDGKPADGKKAAPTTDFGIYKHGFEVKLEGGYLDLMRYLSALESSSWHMLWGGMKLDASAYPKASLTLTVYTLSLDKAWLSI